MDDVNNFVDINNILDFNFLISEKESDNRNLPGDWQYVDSNFQNGIPSENPILSGNSVYPENHLVPNRINSNMQNQPPGIENVTPTNDTKMYDISKQLESYLSDIKAKDKKTVKPKETLSADSIQIINGRLVNTDTKDGIPIDMGPIIGSQNNIPYNKDNDATVNNANNKINNSLNTKNDNSNTELDRLINIIEQHIKTKSSFLSKIKDPIDRKSVV